MLISSNVPLKPIVPISSTGLRVLSGDLYERSSGLTVAMRIRHKLLVMI